jgi:alkylated DNA repair dioxygenase AlkB
MWNEVRPGFYVRSDYFPLAMARARLIAILELGSDPQRGFHHPDLRPNRFHAKPKYPVKKYMGLGLYWNPLNYLYEEQLPASGVPPFAIPRWIAQETADVVSVLFPASARSWQAQAVLVNYYTADSKMSWHVDKEEEDLSAPIVGINFGSSCRFLYEDQHGEEQQFILPGNSVYAFGASARMMRHGVSTVYKNTLSADAVGLLGNKERLNLTVRKVR